MGILTSPLEDNLQPSHVAHKPCRSHFPLGTILLCLLQRASLGHTGLVQFLHAPASLPHARLGLPLLGLLGMRASLGGRSWPPTWPPCSQVPLTSISRVGVSVR